MIPLLGTLNIRGRIIMGTQKGTIILTTTNIYIYVYTCGDYIGTITGIHSPTLPLARVSLGFQV